MAATLPKQKQTRQPGLESLMNPKPITKNAVVGSGKLQGKVAIITGGDSGIGKAVAIAFAKEGANVAIVYLDEHSDAQKTQKEIEHVGKTCLLIPGDVGEEIFCQEIVKKTLAQFGRIDILVNNAAEQHPQPSLIDISAQQLERTFRTNIFSYFFMAKAVLSHLKEGSCIINTTSVTAYKGSPQLLDYSSTKGAIVSFTRSLAQNLAQKKIRVNGVAPGPIWTPLIPSTFDEKKISEFGSDVPLGRPGRPK